MNVRSGLAALAAVLIGCFIAAPAVASAATAGEEPVTAAIPDGHLSGTLLLPAGSGPFPAALIIAGSGPTDRDGNSGTVVRTDAYKKLAQRLAAAGIATLRYDKRGVGASPFGRGESDVRLDDFVNDALVLSALLEGDPRFRSVSIIGHSEGSLIGMLAAQRDSRIHAFVSLEGPGRNLATIVNEQIRANPANPPSIINEVEAINAALSAGRTVPNPDPLLAPLFRPSVQPYLISLYRHDPAQEIARLNIPVLIVQGTTDLQVSIADGNALAKAARHATFALIDGMNHVLVDAPAQRDQNAATYTDPSLPLNATLVSVITQIVNSTR
jgi:alpha-beta hydrolase superfamily lysophospholipase